MSQNSGQENPAEEIEDQNPIDQNNEQEDREVE